MNAKLGEIRHQKKIGNEEFTENGKSKGFTVDDFWKWAFSDLVSNSTRGIFAEFIVAKALEINEGIRDAWDAYDLSYNGLKIEIKTSGYIQTWAQKDFSNPVFSIAETFSWEKEINKREKIKKRQADVYIFCLHHHKDQGTINPLDLSQWSFYVVKTSVLNDILPNQKTITLKKILELGANEISYSEIKDSIKNIC